jgi:hypothetical protein
MKKKETKKIEKKTEKKVKKKSVKNKEATGEDEGAQIDGKKPFWKDNRYVFVGVLNIILIIAAVGFFFFYDGGDATPQDAVNMSIVKDLGAVTIRGDGLPGYDINRDGEADYLSKGFGYYRNIYKAGGFDYGPGEIVLEEFGITLNLPALRFGAEDIRESSIGSVVSFNAKGQNSSLSIGVILKTLGPSLTTYNLFINNYEGKSYSVIDSIDDEEGRGVIAEKEVEIAGKVVFRE